MSYAIYDFTETLAGTSIAQDAIKRVAAAWGEQGDYAEWSGGFLLEMQDGRWAYVSGWCDTTGWGCQDGTNITWHDTRPALESLEPDRAVEWEHDPEDCARFLRGEIDKWA